MLYQIGGAKHNAREAREHSLHLIQEDFLPVCQKGR